MRTLQQSLDMALQLIFDQIRVSYIIREYGRVLSEGDVMMLSRHSISNSAMISHGTRFISLFQCVMNYALTFELEYNVQFLQARRHDMACNMQ